MPPNSTSRLGINQDLRLRFCPIEGQCKLREAVRMVEVFHALLHVGCRFTYRCYNVICIFHPYIFFPFRRFCAYCIVVFRSCIIVCFTEICMVHVGWFGDPTYIGLLVDIHVDLAFVLSCGASRISQNAIVSVVSLVRTHECIGQYTSKFSKLRSITHLVVTVVVSPGYSPAACLQSEERFTESVVIEDGSVHWTLPRIREYIAVTGDYGKRTNLRLFHVSSQLPKNYRRDI